jgi:hypothetical protein
MNNGIFAACLGIMLIILFLRCHVDIEYKMRHPEDDEIDSDF